MLAREVYLDVVAAAIDAITAAGERDLHAAVEHCPGFDVGRLLEHTGGFCRILEGRVARDEEWQAASGSWQEAAEEVAGDPLRWHGAWGAALLDALCHAELSERLQTWAGPRTRYFWLRRAAQELAIHRWDAEHAVGTPAPIDPWIAVDGLDEFLGEFGKRAAPLFGGDGESFLFVTDEGPAFSVVTHAERFDLNTANTPDVEARASAETIYRFVWGRALPTDLRVSGDAVLLERWHERVRV